MTEVIKGAFNARVAGPDAGKAERDTVTTSKGPALYETWGVEKPTLKAIREAMQ